MAQANFNDVVMEKFSGTEPEDDADAFVKQVENKIKVTLGQLPAPGNDRENYLFRQRALFASLFRGPAAEWYAANINEEDAAHTWDFIKREFRTRFTDGRDRYRFRIQAENIKRTENEPIKTYLQRVKKIVDKGWPTIYVVGATAAQRTAADDQMQIHRNEKYISLGSKGLIPNSLKQCAYKRMLEHPNTTWEQLTTHLINKDLCYAMSADGEEHSSSNDKLVNIEKELKSLQEAHTVFTPIAQCKCSESKPEKSSNESKLYPFLQNLANGRTHSNVLSQKTESVKFPKPKSLSPTTK